jgi:CMP-N-acetylneuraminic acid synthetase
VTNRKKLKDLNIVAIIPARGGSKRLANKNIHPVLGKPMIGWVIDEVKNSKFLNKIVVSTEDKKVKDVVERYNVDIIKRPEHLAGDDVEKMDVIQHATRFLIDNNFKPDIVISLQANSPSILVKDLDDAVEFFYKKLYINKPVCEVISVGRDNLQNACFRIMSQKTVFQKTLSTHVGIYVTECHDVHNIDDILIAESQIKRLKNVKV